MDLNTITPLIMAFNEEENISDTLSRLSWATEIIVLDSKSTDNTLEIANTFPNVRLVSRDFDNHTNQWNFGLDLVETKWVLALDADYKYPREARDELLQLEPKTDVYFSKFRYCVLSKPLRSTLYPRRATLFVANKFRYRQDGHTQLLEVCDTETSELKTKIDHDDHKSLSRWVSSQSKYAILEAEKLLSVDATSLGWKDRIRLHIVVAPILTFFYCLICKGLLFDGWHGIYYTLQRVFAELLLSLALIDVRLRKAPPTALCSKRFQRNY